MNPYHSLTNSNQIPNYQQDQNTKNNQKLIIALIAILCIGWVISSFNGVQDGTLREVTVVVVMTGRVDILRQSLNSILNTNRFQNYQYLVVYDGNRTKEITNLISDYERLEGHNVINWIVTGGRIGELACVDLAFAQVQSPYAFLSMGAWNYSKTNYIPQALEMIRSSRDISQVVVTEIDNILQQNGSKISLIDTIYVGFNLLPSLHRMKVYHLIQGGLTNLTRNVTFGVGAGATQQLISLNYYQKGYRISLLNESYARRIEKKNYVYKYLDYKDEYGYKGYWKTNPDQRQMCSVFLDVWACLRKQSAVRRQARNQISRIIQLKSSDRRKDLQQYGISSSIQVGSGFDYINITSHPQYSNITNILPRALHYEEKLFRQEKKIQQLPQSIELASFESYEKVTQFLHEQKTRQPCINNQPALKLSSLLTQNPKNKKFLESQYLFYSQNYGIDQIKTQLKLCIFIQGYRIGQRSNMNNLINSINAQNYSNYQVVFATDENRDYSRQQFFGISSESYPRVINRLRTSLKNEDIIGTPGNHFLRVKQFCRGTDIVVTLQGNSSLIGRQAFNVINTMFQKHEETWLAFFTPLQLINRTYQIRQQIDVAKHLRQDAIDTDGYLIAYRSQLSTKLPIQHVIQFQGNEEDQFLRPKFYESQSNVFHIYSYAELSGPARMKSFNIPIYLFNQPTPIIDEQCYIEKQAWTKTKSLLKYPLAPISSLTSSPTLPVPLLHHQLPPSSLPKIQQSYQQYKKCLTKKPSQSAQPIQQQFSYFLDQSLSNMTVANYYISNFQINNMESMPFCLLVWAADQTNRDGGGRYNGILDSIQAQHYQNYTIVAVKSIGTDSIVKITSRKTPSEWVQTYHVTLQSHSYLNYKKLITNICTQNSVVMFINNPLKLGSLLQINNLHQTENSWMTYTVTQNYVQVISFHTRVYELMDLNDFNGTNRPFFEKGDQQLQVLALLELCPKTSSRLKEAEIYEQGSEDDASITYLRAYKSNKKVYIRHIYQYLLNLQQDYITNLPLLQHHKTLLHVSKSPESRPFINSYLNKIDLLQAYEYEQIPYLPDNHILNIREYLNLDRKYQIGKYMAGDYQGKLVRFCFTVFGRNNTDNGRYFKNLKSVIMQNYSNFHIVFIDDASDDNTLQLSMEYLRNQNFPKDRVTYIKNKQRTFATYNIINAAFNFCGEDDVQVRLDGDDVIIGKNVFGLINSFYQKDPNLYVVYTTFKSSLFTYGMGNEIERIEQMILCNGGRRRFHFIAPLTTWRVKLVRSIPLKYHKLEYGGWLNSLYDDALQFSFLDLAGIDRIKFIPYFAYNYNTGYGSNDNSDKQKIKNRISIFEYVITLDKLQPLASLNDSRVLNLPVRQELAADLEKRYQVVSG